MRIIILTLCVAILLLTVGCCKRKGENPCINNQVSVNPFYQRYGNFWCLGNTEYTYVLRSKTQIDSLSNCNYTHPIPFPVDETDMLYIMVGRTFEFYKDTFQTALWKDTCSKKLIYEVNRVQRDTARYCCPYGVTAVSSMFCSVANIPADYQVEVKYKYVPLPE